MRLPDLMATGWTEVWAHKMCSFLSFFAIAIGIATFFYTLSILSQRYSRLGQTAKVAGAGRVETSTNHPLSLVQYQDLKARLPEGSSLALTTRNFNISNGRWWNTLYHRGNKLLGGGVRGILPSFKDADFVYRLEGRFINWKDVENKHRVVVMTVFPHEVKKAKKRFWWDDEEGVQLVKDYSAHHHLLQQQIELHHQTFTIVGILHLPTESDDVRLSRNREDRPMFYIPYTTWYDLYPEEKDTRQVDIRVVTGKESTAKAAGRSLASYLRSQFGVDEKPEIEFFQEKMEEHLTQARKSLNNMLFMGIIAMIAGGIGIMNVTMAVIFSRTKEIGIRRAIGASRKDILFQFVVEAMLLGLCGSVAGMILGYMAVLHLAEDTSQMTFSWWVVALSVLIALVTSFLFALYPAWQAAKLKPVDALKNE
ncbi:MAG: ABC transporter permease [Elusimicrobiaceae bacterium]|nr:ABC transporter permease [Elusimicrobiaceae bacterium]